ncbi:MAG: potassium channel family protein [Gammaproteobacteria bacterium]|nr:two pore domain potassium channel family protein [Stutzerimonas xanthomarina]MBU0812187.1 potassium channel family protein [Gammaproteobacteria bacterium]HAW26327.1 two pore domain potassium channel family protein [Pseudomonas sp.]MBU0851181.1 potassium channel family protein [Gammaproteobacteria bacterium]MBU1300097.1 potassium channel family protein [Gammaproteobacteria bacterium]|tara:strand:- start:1000 stop:1995 length:996 start_codon:yes stop_codon:yes gene_type:complete
MVFLVLGIVLFLITAMDIIKTTLSTRGGGPITNAVSKMVWHCFFSAAGRRGESRLLEYAGQCVLLLALLTWIASLWLSLFLMLASDPGAVVNDTTKLIADRWETFYYAGFTLSTLGVGDFSASADGWRVLTSAAAFCGLTFITAAITYIVPVLSAVSLQNQLSLLISSMGRTPQEILVNSWNGSDFSRFYDNASDIRQMLVEHTLNHHAYPVIRCFHNKQAEKNVIPAVATLHEVLQLLEGVAGEVPQDALKHKMLVSALDQHLEMQRANYLGRVDSHAKAPVMDLASLGDAGIPLRSNLDQVLDAPERHRLLGALLAADGWGWHHVYRSR